MIRVYVSSVIDAGADSVWARVRDFDGLPRWHPGIADSRIENGEPADRIGCVRHFHTRDGLVARTGSLIANDALRHTMSAAAIERAEDFSDDRFTARARILFDRFVAEPIATTRE